jgi:hypothetical protein
MVEDHLAEQRHHPVGQGAVGTADGTEPEQAQCLVPPRHRLGGSAENAWNQPGRVPRAGRALPLTLVTPAPVSA